MADQNANNSPFEREVAQEGEDNAFGEVIRMAPPSIRMLSILMSFVAFFTSIFIWQVSYTKKTELKGALQIVERPVAVIVPVRGRFESIPVSNGQMVKVGDLLAVIKTDLTGDGGIDVAKSMSEDLEGEKQRIRRNIDRLSEKVQLADDRYKDGLGVIAKEQAESQKILDELNKRGAFLNRKLEKMKGLRDKKILASFELESVTNELTANKERILGEQQNMAAIDSRKDLLRIEKENTLQRIRDTKAELETQITGISRQVISKKAEEGIQIQATAEGKILGLNSKKGDSAMPGVPLFTILPSTGELEGELYVPTKTLAFIQKDAPLYLAIDAFPSQKFGLFPATVKSLEGIPMSNQEREAKGVMEPSYIIKLKLSDQKMTGLKGSYPLSAGMGITTKVTLTTRKLWDWISEPIQKAWHMADTDKKKN